MFFLGGFLFGMTLACGLFFTWRLMLLRRLADARARHEACYAELVRTQEAYLDLRFGPRVPTVIADADLN